MGSLTRIQFEQKHFEDFLTSRFAPLGDWPQRDQEFSIPGFPRQDFAKSQDPRVFWDGISLKFLAQDSTKKVCDLSGLPSQLMNLVNFIHFGQLICL